MTKKGVVEVQFNWIYVGIVGVVILVMFLNIISGIRESSQRQLEYDVLNYFDEIFTSLQGSENTQTPLTLSGLDLEIRTERDDCFFYTFAGSNTEGTSTEFVPLFTPHIIRKEILSYALAWDVPFRANYFLYMTSPDIVYVFVGEDFEIQELYESVPEHLNKELLPNANSFKNNNYYKVRFISFTEDPETYNLDSSVVKLNDRDVSAIFIDNSKESITFYEKQNSNFIEAEKTYYLDRVTLIAAIYSENAGTYECNIDEKAIKRANRVASVLKKRIDILKESNLIPTCPLSKYNKAYDLLTDLQDLTAERGITKEKISDIKVKRDQLRSTNEELRDKACPTIY